MHNCEWTIFQCTEEPWTYVLRLSFNFPLDLLLLWALFFVGQGAREERERGEPQRRFWPFALVKIFELFNMIGCYLLLYWNAIFSFTFFYSCSALVVPWPTATQTLLFCCSRRFLVGVRYCGKGEVAIRMKVLHLFFADYFLNYLCMHFLHYWNWEVTRWRKKKLLKERQRLEYIRHMLLALVKTDDFNYKN